MKPLILTYSVIKQFELTNHLGNVLATVTDKKFAIDGIYEYVGTNNGTYVYSNGVFTAQSGGDYNQTVTPDGTVDYYLADIGNSQDYYPFGMLMPDRNLTQMNIGSGSMERKKMMK